MIDRDTASFMNDINTALDGITHGPDGKTRGLSAEVAVGVLTVRSNLAIADGLFAIADAIRSRHGREAS